MPAKRSSVGPAGESVAARFLQRRGVAILDRNVRVGRDEIDLIARTSDGRVAVEVKTGLGPSTRPWENFDDAKRMRIRRAARSLGIHRVDLVTVELTADRAIVRWLPDSG
jgi:putative endonuclease